MKLTYEDFLVERAIIYSLVDNSSEELQKYPSICGLVSESVRLSSKYINEKRIFNINFARLRKFNSENNKFNKRYSIEYRSSRIQKITQQ